MPTLNIAGTIAFALADESTLPVRSFAYSLVYTEKRVKDLVLTGAQADFDLLDGIADAKAVYIECLTEGGTIEVNGAAAGLPLKPLSGHFAWFNADGGLTAMTVTTADDASFRLYIFS